MHSLFSSDSLLPPPGILEKIKAAYPSGPQEIMHLMEKMQKTAHREELETLRLSFREADRLTGPSFWRNVLKGMGSLSLFPAGQKTGDTLFTSTTALESLNFAWAETGNFMRRAIRQYMAQNAIDAAMIGLTEEEQKGLDDLPVPDRGRKLTP